MGQGEAGGVNHKVTCTWWLLWLAVEMPWLAWVVQFFPRSHKWAYSYLAGMFISGTEGNLGPVEMLLKTIWGLNGCLLAANADHCSVLTRIFKPKAGEGGHNHIIATID